MWIQTSAPNQHWQCIASSADGSKLVAVADNNNGNIGVIYTSTNSGTTWTSNNAPNATWNCVASSADGTHLAATVYLGGIYTSTNAGGNWTQSSAITSSWYAIASSADGSQLFAGGSSVYVSTNSGTTWTLSSAPFNQCCSIACSANGSNLVAGTRYSGNVYISTNSGGTWKLGTNIGLNPAYWASVASSADGTKFLAMGQSVYLSSDAGATWTSPNSLPQGTNAAWVASSADGSHLALSVGSADAQFIGVYISTNSGASWYSTGPIPNGVEAFSANGGELLSCVYKGGIWTIQLPVTPSISLLKAVQPDFSNLYSGTNYQLQVSHDLNTWTNQGAPFTATNYAMPYPQYFNVADWNQLYFRLQVAP